MRQWIANLKGAFGSGWAATTMLGAYFESRNWRAQDHPLARVRIELEERTRGATRYLAGSFEIVDDLTSTRIGIVLERTSCSA